MSSKWESEFRARMRSFDALREPRPGEVSLSLKIRVTSGCFHREHSPSAYMTIDEHLEALPTSDRSTFAFVEHESGPEILTFLALAASGMALAKSVIDLVVAILKARVEGIKQGDRPSEPLELIIRRVSSGDVVAEERILRVGQHDSADRSEIEGMINAALGHVAEPGQAVDSADPRTKGAGSVSGYRTGSEASDEDR